jgi:drug/metabolite transporter (DMT)-like permease
MDVWMNSRYLPLIVGGFIPAILYGVAGIFQKLSARQGAPPSTYLITFGLATVLAGLVFRQVLPGNASPIRSVLSAGLAGLSFAVGAGLVSVALIRYAAAISQLAALFNMNTLITVVLGLVLFAEYRSLGVPRLLLGTALILAGGWLVSTS